MNNNLLSFCENEISQKKELIIFYDQNKKEIWCYTKEELKQNIDQNTQLWNIGSYKVKPIVLEHSIYEIMNTDQDIQFLLELPNDFFQNET